MNQLADPNSQQLQIEVTENPGCQLKFVVTISAELSNKAYREALKNVRKEISLPGFRKGKAPEALVLKNFSSAINREWQDQIVQMGFNQAAKQTGRYPTKEGASSIKPKLIELTTPDAPAVIEYDFEAEPVVPTITPQELSLSFHEKPVVSEEKVNQLLEETRLYYASWEDITDRPAQENDYVRIDLEMVHGDHTHPEFNNRRVQVSNGKMSSWLRELVIGLNLGESKEGISAPDEALNTPEEIKELQPNNYRVKLVAIEIPTLPEVDLEFAKRLGAPTVEELHDRLKRQASRQIDQQYEEELKDKLEELLIDSFSFDIPASLLKKEKENLENIKMQRLKERSNCSEDEIQGELSHIAAEAEQESRRLLTLLFLLLKYNNQNGISVTENEMRAKLSDLLREVPQEMLPMVMKSLNENIYQTIFNSLVTSKGIDHLSKLVPIKT